MLQDRIDQDDQHNIRQDNIAYNRRLYNDPHLLFTEWNGVDEHLTDSSTCLAQLTSLRHVLLSWIGSDCREEQSS